MMGSRNGARGRRGRWRWPQGGLHGSARNGGENRPGSIDRGCPEPQPKRCPGLRPKRAGLRRDRRGNRAGSRRYQRRATRVARPGPARRWPICERQANLCVCEPSPPPCSDSPSPVLLASPRPCRRSRRRDVGLEACAGGRRRHRGHARVPPPRVPLESVQTPSGTYIPASLGPGSRPPPSPAAELPAGGAWIAVRPPAGPRPHPRRADRGGERVGRDPGSRARASADGTVGERPAREFFRDAAAYASERRLPGRGCGPRGRPLAALPARGRRCACSRCASRAASRTLLVTAA